jgi:hypothetical protein
MFVVFEEYQGTDGQTLLRMTDERFKLAGHNLLYKAWKSKGEPINKGWQISREELVRLQYPDGDKSKRLIIDFAPGADWRIGLIEPVAIYAFCSSGDGKNVDWIPVMIKSRDILYVADEGNPSFTPEKKADVLAAVPCPSEPTPYKDESIEFVYMNGGGWNWGRVGGVNATFIQGEARQYFKQFF